MRPSDHFRQLSVKQPLNLAGGYELVGERRYHGRLLAMDRDARALGISPPIEDEGQQLAEDPELIISRTHAPWPAARYEGIDLG